ncbi:MAG: hypothetical protein KJO84_04220, partial [Acidimicrobiia bacterium]|nr:hypothetical protein [Acidimicrobiia bacterium]
GPGGSTTNNQGWTKSDPRGGPTELLPPGAFGPNIDYSKLNDPKNGDKYADKLTMAEMCSGTWIGAEKKVTLGIESGLDHADDKIKFKDKKDDKYGPEDGVYYMIGRSAEVRIEDYQSVYMTIITEKHGNELQCWGGPDEDAPKVWLTDVDGKTDDYGGHEDMNGDFKLEVKKGASLQAHPDAGHVVIFTGGDIEMKIKGDAKKEDQGFIHGLIFAGEQAKLESTDITVDPDTGIIENGALQGGILIADKCDSKKSKLDKNEVKKGDFVYDASMTVPELTPGDASYGVSFTNEM